MSFAMRRIQVGDIVTCAGGYWKVIRAVEPTARRQFIVRWVHGPRPDKGVIHEVSESALSPVSEMQIIALAATEGVYL